MVALETEVKKKKRGRPRRVNEMTPTTATEEKTTTKLVAKKKVFDLEKFEKVTKSVEYEPPSPLTSMDQVISLDEKVVLGIMNLGLVRQAWKDARGSIQGVSPKIINQFVNVWRMLPPYSDIAKKDANGDITKESRREQTQAIYAMIKANETILNSLKLAAANAPADDESDEDGDGEQE